MTSVSPRKGLSRGTSKAGGAHGGRNGISRSRWSSGGSSTNSIISPASVPISGAGGETEARGSPRSTDYVGDGFSDPKSRNTSAFYFFGGVDPGLPLGLNLSVSLHSSGCRSQALPLILRFSCFLTLPPGIVGKMPLNC